MNLSEIRQLKYRSEIFHTNPRTKKVTKWRVNGMLITKKTRPGAFSLPIKHGLYSYGYITQDNAHEFSTLDPNESV